MFGKKETGQAKVLSTESYGHSITTDMHGDRWEHRTYIVEVHPEGEAPFRTEAKGRVCIRCSPDAGDVVKVLYDAKTHRTELDLEGDGRYDPKLRRADAKARKAAEREALLAGAPASSVEDDEGIDDVDDEPWTAPATCPQCGAPVDALAEEVAERHRCQYCQQPLSSA